MNLPSRETNQKTLEEIASAFGDRVVELEEQDVAAEEVAFDKAGVAQVESRPGA